LKNEFSDGETADDPDVTYYPPPISRREPEWLTYLPLAFGIDNRKSNLTGLLKEIYQAVHGGQFRIAAMGIRALLEQMMVAKVGDHGSFPKNLNAFLEHGYISVVQRDAISAVLDAGHAVTHRSFTPSASHLDTTLDITEGVFAAIYIHSDAARDLAKPSRGGVG
jgi:uncharacterized protein DUF4145